MTAPHATEPAIMRRTVENAHIWLNEVADELGTDDGDAAHRALRAVLHVLRDRLPVEEGAQLSAQLPIFVRGVYFENWKPSTTPETYRDVDEFLERVEKEMAAHGETEASFAVSAVAKVLERHVSAGEIEDVRAALPAELRALVFGG